MGNIDRPEEEELVQKVKGIARFVNVEKKARERRQRQELARSQNMINSLLQYSIMMTGGGMFK